MTKKEFVSLFAVIQSNFTTNAKDKEGLKVWFLALQDLDYEIAKVAITKLLLTKNQFLCISDIRNAVADILSPRGNFVDALEILRKSMSKYGYYNTIKGLEYIKENDENLYKVVKSFGYTNLCRSKPEIYRGQLERMYNMIKKRKQEDDLLIGVNLKLLN